jgi:hypothetical protein
MAAKKSVVETKEQIRNRVSQAVAMDPDLDGVDLRVFLYMSPRLNFEDFIYQPQLELSVALGRRKEHISRAIRRLMEAGILVAGPKGTRASEWRLNPDYGK